MTLTADDEASLPDALMIRTAVINELRRKGWSRYQLAKAMKDTYGLSETTIYGWLRGDRGVSVEVVEGIFRVLGAKSVDLRIPESKAAGSSPPAKPKSQKKSKRRAKRTGRLRAPKAVTRSPDAPS